MAAKVAAPRADWKSQVFPSESKADSRHVDIPILDMSLMKSPSGKEKLVAQLKEAVQQTGFFYVTNFGLTEEDINDQFELGKQILDLSTEEKMKYRSKLEEGDYNGYRPLGAIEQFPGLRDNWECYHIFKFIPEYEKPHPDLVRQRYAEIEKFHRHVHENVAYDVLRLISNALELPEETLVDNHKYEDPSSAFLRYVKYHPRKPEVNAKYENIYVRGHTDFGSVTFLFSQPVGGLQLQTRDGQWKDVKHIPGSIVVNTADMLHFWTDGYLQSCVHRVVAPPPEQVHMNRYGLIYFLRPSNATRLQFVDSPLLRRLGIDAKNESAELKAKRDVTVGEWVPIQTKRNWTPFDQQAQSNKEFQSIFRE
ncbi:2OG-Fe(II) oxygenase family oxidoreductase [Xylariales sp. AK1849]|nr:2OG-Fe(II) oxygenase family oxidoreductase [Xylariales sp. AK1849]